MVFTLGLQVSQRLFGLLEDLLLPVEQLLAEIFPLALIHEGFFVGGAVTLLVRRGFFCTAANVGAIPIPGCLAVGRAADAPCDLNDPGGLADLLFPTRSLPGTHYIPAQKLAR